MLGFGGVTTACLAKPRSATFLDENSVTSTRTPLSHRLEQDIFRQYTPTLLRRQMPLSFRGGRPRTSTCICIFQCSAILFHFQPHRVKTALGEVLLYMFQRTLRSEYVNNQYACLYHRVRRYIRNFALYIHTNLPVCQANVVPLRTGTTKHSYRLCNPPSLLHKRYRWFFPSGQSDRDVKLITQLHPVFSVRMREPTSQSRTRLHGLQGNNFIPNNTASQDS